MYTTIGTYCSFWMTLCCPGWVVRPGWIVRPVWIVRSGWIVCPGWNVPRTVI
jgi:hypothetical protein